MKIIEAVIGALITALIFAAVYPLFQGGVRSTEKILQERKAERILGRELEKLLMDIEESSEIRIFEKNYIPKQLDQSFVDSQTLLGNTMMLYFPEKTKDKYQLYYFDNNSLRLYIGEKQGSFTKLTEETQFVMEKVRGIKFIRKEKLIYIEILYQAGELRYLEIQRAGDFSVNREIRVIS